MTKRHFEHAASMVRAILAGEWTFAPPSWVDEARMVGPLCIGSDDGEEDDWRYTRAVQTAEAFLLLFYKFHPHFDEERFLQACGLMKGATK